MSEVDPILLSIEGDASGADEALGSFDEMLSGLDAAITSASDSMAVLDAAMQELSDMTAAGAAALTDLAASSEGAGASLDGIGAAADGASAGVDALATSASTAAVATDALAASSDASTTSVDANTIATDANTTSKDGNAAASGKLNLLLLGAGVAIAAAGVMAVKSAGDFQAGMTTLVTGAGEAAGPKGIGLVSASLLQMSVDTATSTTDLITGMFTIESAGYHGAQGIQVMLAAAEGAKVGNANLASETDVLTTSLHNYHMQSSQAIPVINSFISAVQNGKMVMDDLNTALTNVLPTASKADVSLTDVEGAIATMAASGDRGAAAGTHLSQMFSSLEKPTSAASKTLKDIGLTTQTISDDMKKSLPDTIQTIYDALAKKFPVGSAAFYAAAANIVGGSKQMKAWNELTGTSFNDLVTNTKNITAAYDHSGKSVTGFALVQQEANFKFDQAKQKAGELFIEFGTKLLPMLGNLASFVTSTVLPAIENFAKYLEKNHTALAIVAGVLSGVFLAALYSIMAPIAAAAIAAAPLVLAFVGVATAAALIISHWKDLQNFFASTSPLAIVLKGAILLLAGALTGLGVAAIVSAVPGIIASVAAFGAQAIAAGAAAVAVVAATWPFILIGAAIAAVIGIIILLVTHWKQVTEFLKNVWNIVVKDVGEKLGQLGELFGSVFSIIGTDVHNFIEGVRTTFVNGFAAVVSAVGNFFNMLGTNIHNFLDMIGTDIVNGFNAVGTDVGNFFDMLGTNVHNFLEMIRQKFIDGFNAIGTAFGNFFDMIGTDFHNFLDLLGSIVKTGFEIIVDIITAPIRFIVWLFEWLFVHNYYFTFLVNSIKEAFTDAKNFFVAIWTDIKNFLTAAWNGIKAVAMTIFNAMKNFFIMVITDIKNFFTVAWNDIKKFLMMVWNGIVAVATTVFTAMKNFFVAMITDIQNFFTMVWTDIKNFLAMVWNGIVAVSMTVFTAMKNFFIMIITDIKNFFTMVWNGITTFLGNTWKTIQKAASAAWNLIKQYIIAPVTSAWNTIVQIGRNIISALEGAWNTVKTDVVNAWNAFTGAINNAVSSVSKSIGNIVSAITKAITDMIGNAVSWGENLIKGIIQGIGNMAGGVKDAVGNIIGTIGNFLGFHSPTKEGPGKDADKWMPALGDMLASGLDAQVSKVKQSALHVASALAPSSNVNTSTLSLSGGAANGIATNGQTVSLLTQIAQILLAIQQNGRGNGGATNNSNTTYNIPVNGGTSTTALYRALNQIAGYASEYASRGATAGLGI